MTRDDTPIELDSRSTDGIEVQLLWHPAEDRVTVRAHDARSGEILEVAVRDGDRALDAFQHPYAYAASQGVQPRPQAPELTPTRG